MSKLKEYITQIRGVSYKPEDSSLIKKDGYIPILRANNINDGKINYNELVYVKKEKIKDNQILKKGDILICTSSGSKDLVGKSAKFDDDFICSFGAFCKVIRAKNINELYLSNYFQSMKYKNEIRKLSTGANINNLKDSDFDELNINIIDLEKQLKISLNIDKIFKILDLKKSQKNEYEKLIYAQYQFLFNNIIDNKNNYELKQIREIVDTDIVKLKKKYKLGETINYIDISSIDKESNKVISTTKYQVGHEPSRAQQCLKIDDILMSTVRPNLKNIAIYDNNIQNAIGTSGFCVLRPQKCKKYWLLYTILSNEFTTSMVKKTTGASYPAIKNSDVLDFLIPVPPLEIQENFDKFVELVKCNIKELNSSINEMEKLLETKLNEIYN